MNGLPYYKAYPRDFFEGTIGMPMEMKGPYRLVIDLIYMQGGRLPDDPRYISGLLGCSVKLWNKIRAYLLDAGKIEARDGVLGNLRADDELESLAKLQDKQRENRSRPNKNKVLQSPRSHHTESYTYSEANASDAGGVDFAKAIFENGVRFLCQHGATEDKARKVVGLWRKEYSDKEIFDAFANAKRSGVINPIPWITETLKGKPHGKSSRAQERVNAFIAGARGSS